MKINSGEFIFPFMELSLFDYDHKQWPPFTEMTKTDINPPSHFENTYHVFVKVFKLVMKNPFLLSLIKV